MSVEWRDCGFIVRSLGEQLSFDVGLCDWQLKWLLCFSPEKWQWWPLTHAVVRNNQDWCGKDHTVPVLSTKWFECLSPPIALSGHQFHGHQAEKVKLDPGPKTCAGLPYLLPLKRGSQLLWEESFLKWRKETETLSAKWCNKICYLKMGQYF